MNKREKLKKLLTRLSELAANAQDNGWTDEEREEFDNAEKEAAQLKADIEEEDKQQAADANRLRRAQELQATATQATRRTSASANFNADGADGAGEGGNRGSDARWVRDGRQSDPMHGYRNVGDFLRDVRIANTTGEIPDRLRAMTAGSDEHGTHTDPYGGFLVPESMSQGVLTVGADEDPTAGLVRQVNMPTTTHKMIYRVDKDHSSSVSGGLTVGRRAETQKASASRVKVARLQLDATMLEGLAYVTRELAEQSNMVNIGMLLEMGFNEEFPSKRLDEKINGTGTGEMLGVLNAGCTITVSKESMQAADTINGTNIMKMRKRVWKYSRSIWMANHDCYEQLAACHISYTNDDRPLFSPGNGVDVPDTLLGRPIYFTEHSKALGDKGDLICGVWGEYIYGTYHGMRKESSIHVRFEEHEEVFKFYEMNDGRPWWEVPLTPKNGANTLSPFVTLEARD